MRFNEGMEVNQRWIELRGVVLDAAQTEIGYERRENIRKPWVTKDMINKMNERKEWKSKNTEEGKQRYSQLNNELRRETDKAK